MKKSLFMSVLFFVSGVAIATLLFANPFHWDWVQGLQARVLMALHQHSEEGDGVAETQLWTCSMHPQVLQDGPGSCSICGMDLTPVQGTGGPSTASAEPSEERKISHWRAPMDPTYTSDQPGRSPMGMDLIPVYEDGEETFAPGTVQIDPVFVQNIGVQSTPVARTDIPFTIRTVGNLAYDEQQISWINTKYEGWIESVYVNYVGDTVEQGQRLFEIYSPKLLTAQQEYLQAIEYDERLGQSRYSDVVSRARSLLESSRQRLLYWDLTREQLQELEKSRQPSRTLTVFSPVRGLVVGKMDQALEGMYVKPGMNLYKIADLSTIWLEAEVYEHQISWLEVGQEALAEFPHQPGRQRRGTIRHLYPYFNSQTRTMTVSIELPNPDHTLRADMYANVTFDVPSARGVLAVPEESVIHSGERNVVVLDLGDGTFQVREVVLGAAGNGVWEIKQGIAEGDQVVVSSQFLIDSESNLREAINKLISRTSDVKTSGPSPTEPTLEHTH
jgi:Cu(I)/Ag(I) efflux system membrane fusion protein/cobalt-zinc-cadmium efflux system membrane fusion protein